MSPVTEPTLETLIRDELRAPIAQLVREVVIELVHAELNGHADSESQRLTPSSLSARGTTQERRNGKRRTPTKGNSTAELQECRRCHERKPPAAFEGTRRTCRRCRTAEQISRRRRLARQSEANGDEPTGLASTNSQREADTTATH